MHFASDWSSLRELGRRNMFPRCSPRHLPFFPCPYFPSTISFKSQFPGWSEVGKGDTFFVILNNPFFVAVAFMQFVVDRTTLFLKNSHVIKRHPFPVPWRRFGIFTPSTGKFRGEIAGHREGAIVRAVLNEGISSRPFRGNRIIWGVNGR